MAQKIIKLSPGQLHEVVNEAPFSYVGNDTTETNQNSTVRDSIPYDNPDIDIEPTQANKISHTMSNSSWWNRHYGFHAYHL